MISDMNAAAHLVRDARRAAGLTQAELAQRLGTTQSAIAKLERPAANPTVETLDRVLRATGHRLQMIAPAWSDDGIDIGLLRESLALSPEERLANFEQLIQQARELYAAGAHARAAAA
jgi:transcriptional regulator with XRE-family HTH domain